jgi:hypothetical protein
MRTIQKSLILFGEGKSEAAFLSHLRTIYRSKLSNTRINTGYGSGGSPQCVVDRLIRQHLDLKSSDGALLLIDSDITIDMKLKAELQSRSVKLLLSEPVCLEGLFLKLLDDDGPKKGKRNAGKLKEYFQKKYLKTDRGCGYVPKLKNACPKLFTESLIEQKRSENQILETILTFMGV